MRRRRAARRLQVVRGSRASHGSEAGGVEAAVLTGRAAAAADADARVLADPVLLPDVHDDHGAGPEAPPEAAEGHDLPAPDALARGAAGTAASAALDPHAGTAGRPD